MLHQEVKMDLQEAVFDEDAFREELRTQKLEVAMLEERNHETSKIRQELKDSRIMVHVEVVENPEVWNAAPKYQRMSRETSRQQR